MSHPQALTWLHLFPQGTRCSCATGPEWFQQLIQDRPDGRTARTLVVWRKKWHELSDLPNWRGIVAINGSGFSAAKLREAGFPYVRRFAVLPRLRNARWFISLDSGSVASASFSLYTPARSSAHAKRALARLAARLGIPFWYRDEVLIASRYPPPLETKLAELFPGKSLRLALSSGAPQGAINRKASAAVIDERGRVLAFVKIAGSSVSRAISEHEAQMLVGLQERHRLQLATPRLLFAGEVDGHYITVQTPLQGKPGHARLTPAHERFLDALRNGQIKSAADTNMVGALAQRIDALPAPRPGLREVLEAVLPTLAGTRVASTIVHGDFAPWNLRADGGQISAFDWEYAELDGLPLVDQAHFALQLGLELEHWDVDRAARYFKETAESAPLDLEPEQARAIHVIYLLDNLVRLLGEGYGDDHEMVSLYQQLLARVAARQPEAALV